MKQPLDGEKPATVINEGSFFSLFESSMTPKGGSPRMHAAAGTRCSFSDAMAGCPLLSEEEKEERKKRYSQILQNNFDTSGAPQFCYYHVISHKQWTDNSCSLFAIA